jgi:hypothetical protein
MISRRIPQILWSHKQGTDAGEDFAYKFVHFADAIVTQAPAAIPGSQPSAAESGFLHRKKTMPLLEHLVGADKHTVTVRPVPCEYDLCEFRQCKQTGRTCHTIAQEGTTTRAS